MSHLGMTLIFNSRSELEEGIRLFLLDTFAGYFDVHSAFMSPESRLNRKTGGLESVDLETTSSYRFRIPFFEPLPQEHLDEENQWSTIDLPPQHQQVFDWFPAVQSEASWRIYLFGNLEVDLTNSSGLQHRSLFRQIYPDDPDENLMSKIEPERNLNGLLLYIILFSRLEDYSLHAISICTNSDLWLENGEAFAQQGRATALINTSELAKRISDGVSSLGDAVSAVEWDAIEGQGWIQEANRIWETFQIVPNIQIG